MMLRWGGRGGPTKRFSAAMFQVRCWVNRPEGPGPANSHRCFGTEPRHPARTLIRKSGLVKICLS
jgi:hypothetical protein